MTEITLQYCSKALRRHVTAWMLLPFDTFHPDRCPAPPYRTLYFLNGYLANARQILDTTTLCLWAQRYGLAVVLPDGENSFYVDHPERNALYGTYVAEELVQVTRQLFPLSDRREDTFLGGISMGGFGALMQGMRHPDTFSRIAALSPAAQLYEMVRQNCLPLSEVEAAVGGEEQYLREYDPGSLILRAHQSGRKLPALFFCCGTEDRLTYRVDRALYEKLKKAGVPVRYSEGPGMHDAFYWNEVIPEALEFLVSGASKEEL